MARKLRKEIRIVYFSGDNTSDYYSNDRERLELQMYHNDSDTWEMAFGLPFTKSAEYESFDYLHYSILKDVCQLVNEGFTLVGWFNADDL